LRRVHIPKSGKPGETRPLGIPTVKDRVVMAAAKRVLEPIFEADCVGEYEYIDGGHFLAHSADLLGASEQADGGGGAALAAKSERRYTEFPVNWSISM